MNNNRNNKYIQSCIMYNSLKKNCHIISKFIEIFEYGTIRLSKIYSNCNRYFALHI